MYCEVAVKHKAAITEAGLQAAVCVGQLGVAIPLATAYARSAVYRLVPPAHSVGAFETVNRCFVIVREVNSRFSTYHVEGNSPAVSVPSLLGAVQDFSGLLLPVLRAAAGGAAYQGISFTVQLFEDNARETGIAGKLTTLGSIRAGAICLVFATCQRHRFLDQRVADLARLETRAAAIGYLQPRTCDCGHGVRVCRFRLCGPW